MNVDSKFMPHIITDYPSGNSLIFEEWFYNRYNEESIKSDYEYLSVFWTSYHVNNNYGTNPLAIQELQNLVDNLDRSKKYFTILQYDDGCLVDFKDLNIKVFGASGKDATDAIPLLCKPQTFTYNEKRTVFISFIGSITHPVRTKIIEVLNGKENCQLITTGVLPIEEYCRELSKSVFSLCPRGYGINSFRIMESIQYGAIPIYISDEFSIPSWVPFEDFGLLINSKDMESIYSILNNYTEDEIKKKQNILQDVYNMYYTYEANFKLILKEFL